MKIIKLHFVIPSKKAIKLLGETPEEALITALQSGKIRVQDLSGLEGVTVEEIT